MRINFDKKHYTRAERIFGRLLQELHIPFKAKVLICGREVDFLVGKYAIDIDCHEQNIKKNYLLFKAGYIPIHFSNEEIRKNRKLIKSFLKKIYGRN